MYFDHDLLQSKLAAITALQNGTYHQPEPKKKKYTANPEKVRLREDKKQTRQKLAAEAKSRKEISERVKSTVQARKIKRIDEQRSDKPPVDYSYRTNVSTRDKPLPTRPLNLEGKIIIRINHKTIAYAEPGCDVQAIIAKYKQKPLKMGNNEVVPKHQF